jgi:hypothetical protein
MVAKQLTDKSSRERLEFWQNQTEALLAKKEASRKRA